MVGRKEVGEPAEVVAGDAIFPTIDDHHAGGSPVLNRSGGDKCIGEIVVEDGGAHGWGSFPCELAAGDSFFGDLRFQKR